MAMLKRQRHWLPKNSGRNVRMPNRRRSKELRGRAAQTEHTHATPTTPPLHISFPLCYMVGFGGLPRWRSEAHQGSQLFAVGHIFAVGQILAVRQLFTVGHNFAKNIVDPPASENENFTNPSPHKILENDKKLQKNCWPQFFGNFSAVRGQTSNFYLTLLASISIIYPQTG